MTTAWRMGGAMLLALQLMLLPSAAAAQVSPGAVFVVLPFENPGADSRARLAPGGRRTADLPTSSMPRTSQVVPRDERVLAYDRLQLPVAATLSRASTIKVGQTVGATAVIVGRVELKGDELLVAARVVQLDTGRLRPETLVRGPLQDLFGTVARVAAALSGTSAPPSRWQPPPALAAFELYAKGLSAESASSKRQLLEQALKAAPGYDAARMALWELHTEQGEHQRALDAVSAHQAVAVHSAAKDDSPVRCRSCGSSGMTKRSACSGRCRATRRWRRWPTRSASCSCAAGPPPRPDAPPTTSIRPPNWIPTDGDYFFNLGYAYWLEKDANGAAYWLREAVRRDPSRRRRAFRARVPRCSRRAPRPRRHANASWRSRLSSRYAAWQTRAASGGELIRGGSSACTSGSIGRRRAWTSVVASAGQRDQTALAVFHLDAARRAFEREADREATQELRRALYLSPYLADAHLLLGPDPASRRTGGRRRRRP